MLAFVSQYAAKLAKYLIRTKLVLCITKRSSEGGYKVLSFGRHRRENVKKDKDFLLGIQIYKKEGDSEQLSISVKTNDRILKSNWCIHGEHYDKFVHLTRMVEIASEWRRIYTEEVTTDNKSKK